MNCNCQTTAHDPGCFFATLYPTTKQVKEFAENLMDPVLMHKEIKGLLEIIAGKDKELGALNLQISELQNALKFATDFIDPDVGPSPYSNKSITVTLRKILAEYGKFAEKPKGVSPVDEHACATCGSAGLRDVSHAPCHPVAEKRKGETT